MSRVTADIDPSVLAPPALAGGQPANLVAAIAFDPDDRYGGNALPNDHPRWMKDTLSISQRARALLQKMKPVVMRVITAWDHRVRHITISGRTLKVDASGSYRFD